jgi:GT2 family glycosyltransferase
VTALVRTTLLILSPRRLPVTAKNLALWWRLKNSPPALAIWNEYFNAEEYQRIYPDVAHAGVDPVFHFLLRGNAEYREPCERFNLRYYLGRYPEVVASGVNGLLHYALFGHEEGRTVAKPNPPVVVAFSAPSRPEPRLFINNEWRSDCPLVSVVIPCFNYGRLVEQAIRSVLSQTFSNFEIIVIEGGSTDLSTVDEIRRLEAIGLPNTRFYYRLERRLAGDNRNFGIGLARGRYICCLDADDELRPVYLEVAVFLAEVLGFDIVTPSVRCIGESDLLWLLPEPSFPDILAENQISTAALFRRSAWAHVGGIRDWGLGPQHVHEDWDFWIRLLGHGFLAKTIREPLLLYRVHAGSLSNTARLRLDEQREVLRKANAGLSVAACANTEIQRSVVNPWANLDAAEDTAPGFLLALPFITVGGAEKLFRILSERIVANGQRLVVITSITLPDTVPDDSRSFEEITPHIYHLSKLFSDDETRSAFLRYLIRHYRIETLMLAGSEFAYHRLPDLIKEFPRMAVVDQLFNDTVHVFNNR